MTKGHVFLAQNSDIDYIRQAYALALSIKIHNKINSTCIITNDKIPEEYKHAFDYIISIPWKDSAESSKWKVENRWKIIHATPFEENLVYDVDMILTETNDYWWKYLKNKDFAFTTEVKDYRSNIIVDNVYRKAFKLNNLENVYTGVFYFKKVRKSYELFKWLEFITQNWKPIFKKTLNNHMQTFYSFDVSAALALKYLGENLEKVSVLTFIHMKPGIQSWKNNPIKWTNYVGYTLNKNGSLSVGNFIQNGLFHYCEESFLTTDIVKTLEDIYEKKKNQEFNGVVYSSKYIHYDETGEVFGIGGLPDNNYKNFEILIDLIPNFISYKKNYKNYNIDYFIKIADGIITDENEIEDLDKSNLLFYSIPFEKNKDAEFLIQHDLKNKKWVISSTAYKNKLESVNLIPLYITLKNNNNFLISSYFINAITLGNSTVFLDFLTKEEENINSISLLTIKKFKKYSLEQI